MFSACTCLAALVMWPERTPKNVTNCLAAALCACCCPWSYYGIYRWWFYRDGSAKYAVYNTKNNSKGHVSNILFVDSNYSRLILKVRFVGLNLYFSALQGVLEL